MNKVILTGNLCRDIELKMTQSGKEVITNCVAVSRDFKNAQGEYESDFINIVVWGQQAQYLKNYASKGDRVEIVGKWQARKYDGGNGTQQFINECVVESIKAFGKQAKPDAETLTNFEEVDQNGDLPF